MKFSASDLLRALLKPLSVAAGLFLLLELSTRIYLFGVAGLVPWKIDSVHELPQTGFTQPSSQPGLFFELAPDVDGYFKLVPFLTNSKGLRDEEYGFEKPENTFRVAVLGASFALPAGVAIEDAFHSVLERRLSAEGEPLRFEFINFCVGMYGPEQVMTMLETRALSYDPDLILVSVTSLSAPLLIDGHKPKQPESSDGKSSGPAEPPRFKKSHPILQSFFFRLAKLRRAGGDVEPGLHVGRLEQAWMTLSHRIAARSGSTGRNRGAAEPRNHRGRRVVPPQGRRGSILERLARIGEAADVPIAIVRLEYDASPKTPEELEVEQAAASLGLPYLDTRESFQGRRARDFWIYELDPHPNVEAHGIFADAIAKFLASRDLLVPRSGKERKTSRSARASRSGRNRAGSEQQARL
jgi:hypothetical protein